MQLTILQLRQSGQEGTATAYTTTLHSFMRFRRGRDIPLSSVTSDLITRYEAWLNQSGIIKNTRSFYLRNLRAVYNRAVGQGLTPQRFPFQHAYTRIDKTTKRAVPQQVIRQLQQLDLTQRPALAFARDLFLFSFYTRGMSFVDMAYLTTANLHQGYLVYQRHKTHQQLTIRWEPCMQEIVTRLSRHHHPPSGGDPPYLLPIIRQSGNQRLQYKNSQRLVNHHLKTLSTMLSLPHTLTMYVARHSWASIAKSMNVPLAVISEAMGHDNPSTTLIYLASLDNSIIDKANKKIIENL